MSQSVAGEASVRRRERLRGAGLLAAAAEVGLREYHARAGRETAERRAAEARLRESRRALRAVFDATFQFIGLLAPDGTLLRANRAALEVVGVAEDEVTGLPFDESP